MEKYKWKYVLPLLERLYFNNTSFIMWMFCGAHDGFALLINFLGNDWKLKKHTIGVFESLDTTWQALARNLTKLLDQYGLRKQIVVYVKYEGSNLNGMTNSFKFVMCCEILNLQESFQGSCFGHDALKACQYVTPKKKMCNFVKEVSH